MVDQSTATLTANMAILIAAITELTGSLNEHIRVCHQTGCTHTTQDPAPTEALSELSLTPSPTLPTPSKGVKSPDVIREHLAAATGSIVGPWYVVTVGQEPGLYQDMALVSFLTSGVSGNAYKRYPSQESALEAYECAWSLGAVRRVS